MTAAQNASQPNSEPTAVSRIGPNEPHDRLPFAAWTLGGTLALGAALRLWLAFHDDGIYWPDEIYQSLEPAHRLVFGYGYIPWEFVQGARNWALPGLVAAVLEVCKWLGATDPRAYLGVVRVLFCAVSLGTVVATFRLSRVLGATEQSSACAAAVMALAAPVIYFAPRAMSETASALPVAFGLCLLLDPLSLRGRRIAGASLLGFSVLLRLQCGVFAAGAVVVLMARRRWREAAEALAVLALWAALFGLLDRLTWGGWFHSAVEYLRFNLVEGKAALWGTSGPWYYADKLWSSMPTLALILAVLVPLGAVRSPGLAGLTAAFLLLHSLTPHKELRFILPALPLICALAALGTETFARFAPSRLAQVALLAAALISAARFRELTFGELGQYEGVRPNASAFDDNGPVNRLLLAAHRQPDLCGLKVEAVHIAWSGGYTYFHRDLPLYPHTAPGRDSGLYNYVLTPSVYARGAQVVASDGPLVLARLFDGPCRKDPNFNWKLP